MPWAQIDDNMLDCPKAIAAGPDATDLMLRAIVWCSRHMTDGRIPKAALPIVSGGNPKAKKRVDQLIKVGWMVDDGESWAIVGYLDWNRSRDEIEADRASAKARKDAYLEKARLAKEQKQNAFGTRSERVPNAEGTPTERQPTPLPASPRPAELEEEEARTSACADAPAVDSRPAGPTPEDLQAIWNEHEALPKWRDLTDKRRKAAKARLRERHLDGPDGWREVIARLARSSFATGGGDKGWRATPDWLLQPDTATKALEGAYDGAGPPKATGVYGVDIPPLVKSSGSTDPNDPRWR